MIKERIQKWRKSPGAINAKRRSARQFSQIDDHTLRDIGLTRTQVQNAFYSRIGQVD